MNLTVVVESMAWALWQTFFVSQSA